MKFVILFLCFSMGVSSAARPMRAAARRGVSADRAVALVDAAGRPWGVVFPGDGRAEGRISRMFGPGFDCEPEAVFHLGSGGLVIALYCETVEGNRRTRRSLSGAPGGDEWSALESVHVDGVLWRVRRTPLRRHRRLRLRAHRHLHRQHHGCGRSQRERPFRARLRLPTIGLGWALAVLAAAPQVPAFGSVRVTSMGPLMGVAIGAASGRACEVHDLRDATGRAFALVRPDPDDPDAGCGSRIEGPGFSSEARIRRARDANGPFFVFEAEPESDGDRTVLRQMFLYPKTGGYGYGEAVFIRGELLETVYYPLMPAGARRPPSGD